MGFTVDVSKSGIFLGTSQQLEPGERIRLELMDRERGFVIEGQVARVHRVSLALRHLEQPGVGVRFLSPAELIQEIVGSRLKPAPSRAVTGSSGSTPRPPADPEPQKTNGKTDTKSHVDAVLVEFVDGQSFLEVYQRDIASGGLFVTTTVPAKLHDVVTVELRPPGSSQAPLRFEARVVHCVEGGPSGSNSPRGMGVQFLDPDRVRAALAPVVVELRR